MFMQDINVQIWVVDRQREARHAIENRKLAAERTMDHYFTLEGTKLKPLAIGVKIDELFLRKVGYF